MSLYGTFWFLPVCRFPICSLSEETTQISIKLLLSHFQVIARYVSELALLVPASFLLRLYTGYVRSAWMKVVWMTSKKTITEKNLTTIQLAKPTVLRLRQAEAYPRETLRQHHRKNSPIANGNRRKTENFRSLSERALGRHSDQVSWRAQPHSPAPWTRTAQAIRAQQGKNWAQCCGDFPKRTREVNYSEVILLGS